MSTAAAQLIVQLVGDNTHLTQTLNQSSQQGTHFGATMLSGATAAAAGLAAVAAAGLVVVGAMDMVARENAVLGRELQAQAVASNLTVETLQEIGYAAETAGIDASKAGDIFKDFQDKLGDFRSTGGGAFADFFEQVGDKVGLSADALAKMAGPDALIAVKKAMDDANVSADRQIFYLEALAGDASRLTPLLEDNGKAFREMVARYREMDVALTDSEIEKFKDYDQDVRDLQLAWDALSRETVLPFVGLMAENVALMAELFGTSRTEHLADLREELADLGAEVIDLEATGKKYGGGITGMWDAMLGENGTKGARIAERKATMRLLKEEIAALSQPIDTSSIVSGFVPPDLPDPTGGTSGKGGDSAEALQKSGAAYLAQMDIQIAGESQKLTIAHQQRLEKIQQLTLSEAEIEKRGYESLAQLKTDYLVKSDLEYQLAQETLTQKKDEELLKTQEASLAEIESIRAQFLTPDEVETEAYDRRQEILNNALATKLIEEERHQTLSAKNWEKYQDVIAKSEAATQTVQLQGYSSLFGGLADITKTFAGEQSGAYKAMFLASKAFSIAQSIVAIQTGIAQAAANPWPLNLAAMASVAASTVSIISTIQGTSIDGQAHDGIDSIPEDGTWNLQKGERVIKAAQNTEIVDAMKNGGSSSGNSGGITVNIVPNAERAGEVEESGGDDERQLTIFVNRTLGELNDRIARGGNASSRTMEGTYGLSRAAGARR